MVLLLHPSLRYLHCLIGNFVLYNCATGAVWFDHHLYCCFRQRDTASWFFIFFMDSFYVLVCGFFSPCTVDFKFKFWFFEALEFTVLFTFLSWSLLKSLETNNHTQFPLTTFTISLKYASLIYNILIVPPFFLNLSLEIWPCSLSRVGAN